MFRSSRDTRQNEPFGYWTTVLIVQAFPATVFFVVGALCLYAIVTPS